MSGRLTGKRALVTGGSRGIGRAICIGFAREGASVAVLYRQQRSAADETVERIESEGGTAIAVQANIAVAAEVDRAVEETCQALGGFDILVNNAAMLRRQPFLEISESDWDETLAVNLKGYFLVSRRVVSHMIKAGRGGSIINVSSISWERAAPGLIHYQCSQAGRHMLTKGMAFELAEHQIRVNEISPGTVDTDLSSDMMSIPEVRAQRVANIPLGRAATPEDLVGAAVYFASDESVWVTGAFITIDGGYTTR